MFFILNIGDWLVRAQKKKSYVKDLKFNQTKANISQALVLFVHMEINWTCTLNSERLFIYLKAPQRISMTTFEVHKQVVNLTMPGAEQEEKTEQRT